MERIKYETAVRCEGVMLNVRGGHYRNPFADLG